MILFYFYDIVTVFHIWNIPGITVSDYNCQPSCYNDMNVFMPSSKLGQQ